MSTVTDSQRSRIMIGCYFVMFTIAAYGLSLATIQQPMLDSMGGGSYFSLITLIAAICMTIMTPIGGRLIDGLGNRKVTLYAGAISLISGLVMAFVPNLWVFIIMRILFSMGQGAMSSVPYILAREVNPPQVQGKIFGMLATVLAVGSFVGSWLAGVLVQNNLMWLAVAFPCLTLAPGTWLIYQNMYDDSHEGGLHLDWMGMILLTVCLSTLLLAMNFGARMGWFNGLIMTGFLVGFGSLLAFVYWENRAAVPLVPMALFQNRQYVLLLAITFCTVFYLIALNNYLPLGVQNVLQAGTSASGSLQLSKTIVLILVPTAFGIWVAKRKSHTWMALALSCIFVIVPCALLVFVGVNMPIWFIMLMVGLTGIADAFRSVAATPAAQEVLKPSDLGIGTSMIGFTITLANSIAATVDGIAYDSLSAAEAGIVGMSHGIDTTFLLSAGVAVIGLLLVVLFFRPIMNKNSRTSAAEQAKTARD